MKKLELLGSKKKFGFIPIRRKIATVWVDGEGELRVEAWPSKIQNEVERAIRARINAGGFALARYEEKVQKNGKSSHRVISEAKLPGDAEFLEAVQDSYGFWKARTFGGYEIDFVGSQIVEA